MTSLDLDRLRSAYAAFLGEHPGRVLLTGHSHQAWPDVARRAMAEYFDDSARLVDDKWGDAVFPRLERVGRGVLERLGFATSDAVAFGRSTHELVYRLLSCLPRDARVVTTTGEFHSLYRQLRRLEEDGLRVTWASAAPRDGLVDRLLDAIVPGVHLVAVSAVLFEDAYVLPRLGEVIARAVTVGALPLVDAYHAFNVVPLSWGEAQAEVFAVAGGYKYAAFGEGVCFMRLPARELRPAYTGWFADFAALERPRGSGLTTYGAGGMQFAGATFDACSFYRAAAVLDHWEAFGLDVPALREISLRQTTRIREQLLAAGLDVVASADPERRGGFVAVRVAEAAELVRSLRARDVWVDARGDLLRLGPAPYLTDEEIDRGVSAVVELAKRSAA
jgi:selenocysteine lyase/cysteine desulfurase